MGRVSFENLTLIKKLSRKVLKIEAKISLKIFGYLLKKS